MQIHGVGTPHEMQQQPPDRIGRAPAIVEQFSEVGIARLDHILREGVEQVAQQLDRQAPFGNDGSQHVKARHLRAFAPFNTVKLVTIGIEALQAFRSRRFAFVGDVVGRARKAINGLNGTTQCLGQQD